MAILCYTLHRATDTETGDVHCAPHPETPLIRSQVPALGLRSQERSEHMLSILWTIIIGFIVGVIAKLIHPGRENFGFVETILLGIGGSLLATYGGQAIGIYHAGQPAGFIGSIVGAIIILAIYTYFKGRANTTISQ
jgi:uncharacterized membrane protein YeaQ/YmgE (transglycosylase-associated protein family)